MSNHDVDGKYCRSHRVGVPFDAPKFFIPGCEKCEAKKAAGLVTGKEGPLPKDWRHKNKPFVDMEKRRRAALAMRMWEMGIGKGAR